MSFIKPTFDDEAFEKTVYAEKRLAPAGKYAMSLKRILPLKESEAGNSHITFILSFADGQYRDAYYLTMVTGISEDGRKMGNAFIKFLLALGIPADVARTAQPGISADGKTGVIALNDDIRDLTGKTLMASVRIEQYKGKDVNRISLSD